MLLTASMQIPRTCSRAYNKTGQSYSSQLFAMLTVLIWAAWQASVAQKVSARSLHCTPETAWHFRVSMAGTVSRPSCCLLELTLKTLTCQGKLEQTAGWPAVCRPTARPPGKAEGPVHPFYAQFSVSGSYDFTTAQQGIALQWR